MAILPWYKSPTKDHQFPALGYTNKKHDRKLWKSLRTLQFSSLPSAMFFFSTPNRTKTPWSPRTVEPHQEITMKEIKGIIDWYLKGWLIDMVMFPLTIMESSSW